MNKKKFSEYMKPYMILTRARLVSAICIFENCEEDSQRGSEVKEYVKELFKQVGKG